MMNAAHYKITVGDRVVESQNQLFEDFAALFASFEDTLQMRVGVGTVSDPFSESFDGPLFRSRPLKSIGSTSSESEHVTYLWSCDVTPDINMMKTIRGIELYLVFVPDEDFTGGRTILSRTILETPIEIFPSESVGLIYSLPSTVVRLSDDSPQIQVRGIATSGTLANSVYVYPGGSVPLNTENFLVQNITPLTLQTLSLVNDNGQVVATMRFVLGVGSGTQAIVDTGYGSLLFSFNAINDIIRVTFDKVIDRSA
jgi:hypothetical protein